MNDTRTAMREGFTTGSAATAAAMAAAMLLFGHPPPERVSIPLPPIPEHDGIPDSSGCPRLDIPIAFSRPVEGGGCAGGVIKDGGDDPDATHGARIEAVVAFEASGAADPGFATGPMVLPGTFGSIFLYGGTGIGRITLPGLPAAVGEPAINPEPRRQIAAGLSECMARSGHHGPLHCLIRVPEGAARARQTLNARLGIVGGISILGTRGTVKPYSHDAWRHAVSQGMDVARALGCDTVCLSTGRRSEKALLALFPDLPEQSFIQVADYAEFSLEEAARHGFSRVIWACFPGKLLKLAQGLGWTHAKGGDPDFSLLRDLFHEAGAPPELLHATEETPTALGALAILRAHDPALEAQVLARLAGLAHASMRGMLAGAGAASPPSLSLRVFSLEDGRLTVSLG